MKTRAEKIFDLTKHELVFLMDSPEYLDDVTKFFAEGAYHAMTKEDLDKCYQLRFEEEVNEKNT